MGTRADFYVGRGLEAEWLGSIAWDGHPCSIDIDVLRSTSEAVFRANVERFLEREDGTLPEMGWPWPWNDSRTTDYAYALDGGSVWASSFGHEWFKVDPEVEDFGQPDSDAYWDGGKTAAFPDMTSRKAVTYGKRSGLIVFGAP